MSIASGIFDLRVAAPKAAAQAKAGQFAHILCEGKTLRRPISIGEIDQAAGTLRLIYEVRGEGTAWLSTLQPGDMLDILAPLGKGFDADGLANVVLVGGGIGVPPLLETAKTAQSADALLGFRSARNVILQENFAAICQNVKIATEDGSLGEMGFVTPLLEERLMQPCSLVCACGPGPMLKAVAEICARYEVKCQVSLEERMACGIGACLVCACRVRGEAGYLHVCKAGPVFDAKDVVW